MDVEEFVRQRIRALRLAKGVSAYSMSTEMGKSKYYIGGIESWRASPSLSQLQAICDYFSISIYEFFSESTAYTALMSAAITTLERCSDDDIARLLPILQRLSAEK